VKLQVDLGSQVASVAVPREAFELFVEILDQMANSNAVTLVPTQSEFTTQEAAELLGVSRPHLIGLLDEGRIPHHEVGTHWRVRVADVVTGYEPLIAAVAAIRVSDLEALVRLTEAAVEWRAGDVTTAARLASNAAELWGRSGWSWPIVVPRSLELLIGCDHEDWPCRSWASRALS